eukprot:m51a1_g10868 hypothetical protein (140) ;mRNA; r:19431-19850
MVLIDGKRRVCKLWGYYSPKFYDGEFLKMNKKWFKVNAPNDVLIGNCHFAWGRGNLEFPKLYAPWPRPPKPGKNFRGAVALTKEKKKYNAAIKKARGRIKSVFGEIKQRWKALSEPWRKSFEQQENLVWITVAIHNVCL